MKKQKLQTLNINDQTSLKDTSPIISQRSKFKQHLSIFERSDFTLKQQEFINLALDKNTKLMFVSGPSGTTKSYLAIYCALHLLNQKKVSDLIYVRSAVESASNSLGYLPGVINDKFQIYLEPLNDKLNELLPKNEIDMLRKDQRITGVPINFLRGLNWNAKVIIADEAQNLDYKELTTFMTRIGEYSKVFILGDPEQSDLNGRSGFYKFLNLFDDMESRENGIYTFRFEETDILRSKLVRFVVNKLRTLS